MQNQSRDHTAERSVNTTSDDNDLAGASSKPKLPHDRDESVGTTDGAQSAQVKRAASDVKRGVEDTSRGQESDDTYKKLKK